MSYAEASDLHKKGARAALKNEAVRLVGAEWATYLPYTMRISDFGEN